MTKPCFCEKGIISQCIAKDMTEQQSCEFFTKSIAGNRCMNRNENLGNHCWDAGAQAMGVIEAEEELLDVDSLIEDLNQANIEYKSCVHCEYYICPQLQDELSLCADRGLFIDYENVASKCLTYSKIGGSDD